MYLNATAVTVMLSECLDKASGLLAMRKAWDGDPIAVRLLCAGVKIRWLWESQKARIAHLVGIRV